MPNSICQPLNRRAIATEPTFQEILSTAHTHTHTTHIYTHTHKRTAAHRRCLALSRHSSPVCPVLALPPRSRSPAPSTLAGRPAGQLRALNKGVLWGCPGNRYGDRTSRRRRERGRTTERTRSTTKCRLIISSRFVPAVQIVRSSLFGNSV